MLCHSSEDGLQECSSLALLSFIGSMYVFVYRPPTAHGVANFSASLAFSVLCVRASFFSTPPRK